MSQQIWIGTHDDGNRLSIFYTGLKTKDATKKAVHHRFGEGSTTFQKCEVTDREIIAQVLYMKLTLSERSKEVLAPVYITPHRNEKYDTQRDQEIKEFSKLHNVSEFEAYEILFNGQEFDYETSEEPLYSDIPF